MMLRSCRALAVLGGLSAPAAGWAMTCEEILTMLDDGLSAEVVAGTLQSSGQRIGTSQVACLVKAGAPAAVVDVARELADLGSERSSGGTGAGGADWLDDVAEKPDIVPSAPEPAPPPPPPPPPPKPAPVVFAAPAGILTAGSATSGSDLTKGATSRIGWLQPISEKLWVEGRLSYFGFRGEESVAPLTRTLVMIAQEGSGVVEFQQPVQVPTLKVEGLAELGLPRGWGQTHSAPRLRLGAWGGLYEGYYAVYDDGDGLDLDMVSRRMRLGTVAEVSQEFWGKKKLGLRLVVGVHSSIDKKPQYDPDVPVAENQIYNEVRLGVDWLLGLGAR